MSKDYVKSVSKFYILNQEKMGKVCKVREGDQPLFLRGAIRLSLDSIKLLVEDFPQGRISIWFAQISFFFRVKQKPQMN